MPSLSKQQASQFVKLLAIGDPKTGKTGSFISLVEAGYKLRILDFDNLLDILRGLVMKQCPDKVVNVEYVPLRDKRKASPSGPIIDGQPKAFVQGIRLLDHWKDGDLDLGVPATWGPECILVIDSLSRLCDAAYDFHAAMAGPKSDGRAIYGSAQDAVESILAMLTSESFASNVIVVAHVQYMDMPDGTKKGFPQGVGQKLSPKIPQYFPTVVYYTNQGGKRTIQTNSTPLIDLANPKPFDMQPRYPLETGLAEIFRVLLGEPPKAQRPKLTLKRA